MKIKHNLIKNQTLIKKIISHIRINSKTKTIVNKISFKYRQYKNVLKKSKKELSLLNYSKNDYKIILKNINKFKIELIYNINKKQIQILKKYIDKNLIKKYIYYLSFKAT